MLKRVKDEGKDEEGQKDVIKLIFHMTGHRGSSLDVQSCAINYPLHRQGNAWQGQESDKGSSSAETGP